MKIWNAAEGASELGLVIPPITIDTSKLLITVEKQLEIVKLLPDTVGEQVVVLKEAERIEGEEERVTEDGKVIIIYPFAGIGSFKVTEKL